jgi:hypothetical protein
MSPAGLLFTRMRLAQQQFRTLGLSAEDTGIQSLEELAGAALRVEYTRPRLYAFYGLYRLSHASTSRMTSWRCSQRLGK